MANERGIKMGFKFFLWLVGMFIVGFFLVAVFWSQVMTIKRCALKLVDMIRYERDLWFSESCEKYFKSASRRCKIIVLSVIIVVLLFVPKVGLFGFFIGMFASWLICLKETGMTEKNLFDTAVILMRFAKPGMEDKLHKKIGFALEAIENDTIYKVY